MHCLEAKSKMKIRDDFKSDFKKTNCYIYGFKITFENLFS